MVNKLVKHPYLIEWGDHTLFVNHVNREGEPHVVHLLTIYQGSIVGVSVDHSEALDYIGDDYFLFGREEFHFYDMWMAELPNALWCLPPSEFN